MKKKITQRILKSWKTTLIGCVLLIAAITSVFLVDNINWFDASIGVGIGLALLFAPDTILQRLSGLFTKTISGEDIPPTTPV